MPVAVARKIEFFQRTKYHDLDIQIQQIALTQEQCRQYQLPRTPIKEKERRGAKFEAQYGEGATELDALEALYPGELSKIVVAEIERYYDHGLDDRCSDSARNIVDELEEIQGDAVGEYGDEIEVLRTRYSEIEKRFEAEVSGLKGRVEEIWQAISSRMEEADLPDLEVPEAETDPESEWESPLYSSDRDYEEQIGHYKMFQNGNA